MQLLRAIIPVRDGPIHAEDRRRPALRATGAEACILRSAAAENPTLFHERKGRPDCQIDHVLQLRLDLKEFCG
jgi:hypothetical protein